jgi:nucleotide-binding universal stress UspA family protein
VEEERHQALEDARAELERRGHTPKLIEAIGDPADCTIQVARTSHADLVVVGSRGRNVAERAVLGSVSSKLAHHCPCDLLIVRNTNS